MHVPHKIQYLTTWNWWLVVGLSMLHLLNVTPPEFASGVFPITFGVAIIGTMLFIACNTSNVCPTKHYKRYSEKYDLRHRELQFEQSIHDENISTHLFPLLLLSAVLLTKPSKSLWWQRFSISAVIASIYIFNSCIIGPDINKIYSMPLQMYFGGYLILLGLSFVPV